MHLKYSKGSRQARQRCRALQGVEPNSLTHSVSVEWQRGQPTRRSRRNMSRMEEECSGGTMPYINSLRRPSAVIQSLLQAGDSTEVTVNPPTSAALKAAATDCRITSVAGHPT